MRLSSFIAACGALWCTVCAAESNLSEPLSSHQILPNNFKPPQVFKNTNLVRTINLEKSYVRETINVIIENTDSKPQDEYYIPFPADTISKVGGLQVRDKKNTNIPPFKTSIVEYDTYSSTQFFHTTLPSPLAPSAQLTVSITFHILSTFKPLPAKINQQDKQYLTHTFSTYFLSAYPTTKQKTKVKFPSSDIPDYSLDPDRQGSTFHYGPYSDIAAGAAQEARVRYEFTKPLIHTTLLERDLEVSHWGGNLATEERYWTTNLGAELKEQFSRVQWALTQHYSPPTSALRALSVPLKPGSMNPYFTDDIGNVSTSRFRRGKKEALLELRPRYPVFGGWNYSFRIGWDADLRSFLRTLKDNSQGEGGGRGYVLKVPFLEGPKMNEGVSYRKVEVRVVLPEGARDVKFETEVPLVSVEETTHRTFMDTVGRTTLKLTAMNVVDDSRDIPIVVTYNYPSKAALRKPLTIFGGILAVFVTAWAVGQLDVSIGSQT